VSTIIDTNRGTKEKRSALSGRKNDEEERGRCTQEGRNKRSVDVGITNSASDENDLFRIREGVEEDSIRRR